MRMNASCSVRWASVVLIKNNSHKYARYILYCGLVLRYERAYKSVSSARHNGYCTQCVYTEEQMCSDEKPASYIYDIVQEILL